MPELPEVEVIRRGLAPLLTGRRVARISWSDKKLRAPMPHALLHQWILGQRIRGVDRRAKYLLIRMENLATLVFHLGMTGKMGLAPQETPPAKHDHLQLLLDNGSELRFNDSRRFGAVLVLPPGGEHEAECFGNQGPEPFSKAFCAEYLAHRAHSRTMPVKLFLMDGRVVAGIGNIYANEILFAVRIHPATPAAEVSRKEWQEVVRHSRMILKKAIKAGGSTISDFLNANGEKGYFQLSLNVYNRQGTPCSACKTPIEKSVMGGRATYFCPRCQK